MSWDQVLMAFVNKMINEDIDQEDKEFFITREDVISFTGLSPCAVSRNLTVCVKNKWLKKIDKMSGEGREVRYYLNNKELFSFVDKYLRD